MRVIVFSIGTSAILVLALLDLVASLTTIQQIREGSSFIYWSNVNTTLRPPIILIGLCFFAFWYFLRSVFDFLSDVNWLMILASGSGCILYAIVVPVLNIGAPAFHLQRTISQEGSFHLYYQSYGIFDPGCRYVVTECDSLGIQCRYLWHIDMDVCMGAFAPIQIIQLAPDALSIVVNEEVIVLSEAADG